MSRSELRCRECGKVLGNMKPSNVLHPDNSATRLIFVDNGNGTATFICKECGATMVFRGGRIDLNDERKTA